MPQSQDRLFYRYFVHVIEGGSQSRVLHVQLLLILLNIGAGETFAVDLQIHRSEFKHLEHIRNPSPAIRIERSVQDYVFHLQWIRRGYDTNHTIGNRYSVVISRIDVFGRDCPAIALSMTQERHTEQQTVFFGKQCIALLQNTVPKTRSLHNTHQLHVMSLSGTLSGGFKFQDAQMKIPQNGPFHEGYVLNVFQRNGLLHLYQNSFFKPDRTLVQFAFQSFVIMTAPPLTNAQQPERQEENSKERNHQKKADVQNHVGLHKGIE
ncbi:hypothetical protein COLO4_02567 [Corchorus olitorius]|uniref:Uncharacterized protein n=1 Tax=Corchorus olitorius TaxID=93759 RepID=A0A1R3L0U3_9ROSI|nr:hypothetical protein COLO4_02567 [Corchorus olitorius]